MELTKEVRNDITVISINGDIDGATAPQLQNFVLAEVQPDCRIFLDTSKVEYMSSAGLRVLLVLYRKINESKGTVVLVGVSSDIYDAMSATGFLRHFTLVDTFEEGVKALTS
jgi:anti-sigma B factor antagonist